MTLSQAQIAREIGMSEMTVYRRLCALGRSGKGVADLDAVSIFSTLELENFGLAGHVAIDLLAEFSSEVRYCFGDNDHKCWIVFVETDKTNFRVASISASHFAAILSAFPLSLVLALHEPIHRAKERLEVLKVRLNTREAA